MGFRYDWVLAGILPGIIFGLLIFLPVHVAAADARGITAVRAVDFLNSIGIDSTMPDRGQSLPKTVEMVKYTGFRWLRGGIEGLTTNGPTTVQTYLDLHKQTGVRFSWGLVSGGTDLKKLIESARQIAAADALLATVNLGSKFGSVKVYDPTVGTSATQTLKNILSVPLTLSDHPVIIELLP